MQGIWRRVALLLLLTENPMLRFGGSAATYAVPANPSGKNPGRIPPAAEWSAGHEGDWERREWGRLKGTLNGGHVDIIAAAQVVS